LGSVGRGGYRRRSSAVIGRITSTPLSTCSRTSSSLAWRFSSARSRAVFTESPRDTGPACWTSDPRLCRRLHAIGVEIHCVGCENLAGAKPRPVI
jgi:hypothetical protein